PAPARPRNATYSPDAMENVTPRSAGTLMSPISYVLVICSISMTVPDRGAVASTSALFIAQTLDRIQIGSAHGRIRAEQDADTDGKPQRDRDDRQPRERHDGAGQL